ncbi:LAG1-DNAbind-domain-containing protein [Rhizophagus clarus]|uniref:LAG1-DNAbind-domain-containing protein n=1 Tax=Rhizophagus clarus TaxID=94130 RepID=A0A8H3R2V6_9GLOM|nr:LAG1-DNAbind-domain-containing protein [Rhizophagus clarus]
MVHSSLSTDFYSSYPVVHNPQLASNYNLDNMSSKSCNGTESKINKKRKPEYHYPITHDYYLPNQQQKTQLIYQPQPHQQLVNVAYQHHQQQIILNQPEWSEFVRSSPSTPTSSPPPNVDANSNNNNNNNNGTSNALYNPYTINPTTIPMNASSDYSSTVNFGYDDNTSSCSMNDHHQHQHNICNDTNENEERKNNTMNGIHYDNLDQLAAAAAFLVDSRDDKSSTYGVGASSINEGNIRNNRSRPHLMPLNITSATTESNVYRLGSDFNFTDSIASSPSPAVTMPPTPVFFEPEFLDGVTNTMPEGFSFGINPTLTSGQLLENNNSISVSRSHSYDSISSSSQQSNIFTSEKIIENPQTVTPAAISITQPDFTPMLSQPSSSTIDMETDYFNSKQHRRQNHCEQANNHNNNNIDNSNNNTVRRTRSRTLSNPPNIKSEPRTPALSPPESPGDSVSSNSSSPPSPSPPQTPNYMRRMSISPTIMEEEEETVGSNSSNTTESIPIVTSSSYVSDVHNINSTVNPRNTTVNIMRPIIQQYLNSSNPAALGEKTVMVLTSKVAQKSYGTEKRFLCPPPTTLILGSNWWCPSPHNIGHSSSTTFSPPKISVGISGEQGHQQGILEWISPSGNPLDPTSCSEMAFSGKCVSKHLYINDADEKRKRVEVLVNIHSPMGHNFGTFASKPIKVISKPSKKRQSVKNMELCIHHGTTISLFNRIRSQTVSTKYLGVSMQNANQTFGPWYGNVSSASSNPNDQPHPCFVARTGSWDPFIIWIVDPHHVKGKDDHSQHPPHPNFPRPPPSAIKSNPNNPTPIHYNQPIVLQCLTTGMTSPIMIIRKVDKGSMVIGGGIIEPLNGYGEGEEALGDPVSQLHKVAFQIKDVNMTPTTSPTFQPPNQAHPPGPGTYLACLGDVVGMQRANEGRKIISQPSTPVNTSFLDKVNSPIPSPTSEIPPAVAVALAGSQTNFSFDSTPLSESAVVSTEGGKVIRKRRVSSSVVIRPTTSLSKSTLAKNRRRVNSLSGVASEVDLAKYAATTRNAISGHHRSGHDNAGALWTEDVTDAAVWTIVGTDCASYTFYSPQNMIGRQMNSTSHLISPLPPSTPVTPLPIISNIITATSSPSNSASSQIQNSTTPNTITIYGENFTRDLMVWFGDLPSPRVEFRSKDCLVCLLPEELMYEMDHHNNINRDIVNASIQGRHFHLLSHGRIVGMNSGRPILFSRNDGIVFKTGKVWP